MHCSLEKNWVKQFWVKKILKPSPPKNPPKFGVFLPQTTRRMGDITEWQVESRVAPCSSKARLKTEVGPSKSQSNSWSAPPPQDENDVSAPNKRFQHHKTQNGQQRSVWNNSQFLNWKAFSPGFSVCFIFAALKRADYSLDARGTWPGRGNGFTRVILRTSHRRIWST